jgi:predicted neutral ceramidase superfamily lipid hydrolase
MESTNNTSKQDGSIGFLGAVGVFAFGAIAILGILIASGVSFSDMFSMGGGVITWLLVILATVIAVTVIITNKEKSLSQKGVPRPILSNTFSLLVWGCIVFLCIVVAFWLLLNGLI